MEEMQSDKCFGRSQVVRRTEPSANSKGQLSFAAPVGCTSVWKSYRPRASRVKRYWFVGETGRGEMGTGARGAPIPEVGLYMKIKRAQFRNPESRPNEGHVNSP